MKRFTCSLCGYVVPKDEECPVSCPHCGVVGKFRVEEVTSWAYEHRVGSKEEMPSSICQGLIELYRAKCAEVGVDLAMARQAERDGYPEISEVYRRCAVEVAGHAARLAEILGEGLSSDTRKNVASSVEAKQEACAKATVMAEEAAKHGYDIVQDVLLEIAGDEARHGSCFEGILKRYSPRKENHFANLFGH